MEKVQQKTLLKVVNLLYDWVHLDVVGGGEEIVKSLGIELLSLVFKNLDTYAIVNEILGWSSNKELRLYDVYNIVEYRIEIGWFDDE